MGTVSSLRQPVNIGFYLCDRFTMLAMASAIEVLRMANQLSGETLYQWHTLSEDGQAVSASDSLQIGVDGGIPSQQPLDIVIVCGGLDIEKSANPRLLSWLASLDRKHVTIGAICTGSFILAKAGIMQNKACSIHWEYLAGFQEAFPAVRVSNKLFSIDEQRMTSAGGTAPMDMMLNMVTKEHGNKLSAAISEMFMCERVRNSEDVQKIPLRNLIGTAQPKLLETVSLMEANLEEPFCIDELASLVQLSRRQLERLFQRHIQCSPSRYYLHLRLSRAKQLLIQTNLSIIEISIACGFVSTPHFSKCYRDYYGIPPREERVGMRQDQEPTLGSVSLESAQIAS
ncbi:HTH-type transcriptional regulator CdhR [Grimontia celer]|uniref:HTH-type transcriptional regulator CdhR n=1 Tax=Grimontia celer TaxID=1796497 RepID=A0A128F3A9_9GAMM|nr:GlxA family transcriptional regulator [Grimontia celer]CZF81293.1 HTH-type transcriptional regulator CdhR [Grimontia celer]